MSKTCVRDTWPASEDAGKDPWEHNAATRKATASCSCRSIQCLASEDLKKGSEGDSSSESMSPKNPSESHSMRSGRDSGECKEDTTRGIGGGEAEESLDPGILAKRVCVRTTQQRRRLCSAKGSS